MLHVLTCAIQTTNGGMQKKNSDYLQEKMCMFAYDCV